MKLLLIGFGVVGQGFAQILSDKADMLKEKYDFSAEIVGIITGSKGTLYHPDGLSIPYLQEGFAPEATTSEDDTDAKKASKDKKQAEPEYFAHYPDSNDLKRDWDPLEMIAESNADVVIEMSPTNLETGQPALEYCHAALDNGKHLVLANKGPVALAYTFLKDKAKEKGLHFRYEATVMAGTPTIQLALDALAGCEIESARGILNGTTNYILTQMEEGMSYQDALTKAQELGYAETDPSGDVEGWDAAGKVLILSKALFGATYTMNDLDVEGITKISDNDIKDAQKKNERYKLIATVSAEGGSVKPVRLPVSDPLASVGGATNAITLKTDLMGDVTLIGAGAGQLETGQAILSDLLAIQREVC